MRAQFIDYAFDISDATKMTFTVFPFLVSGVKKTHGRITI
jgi:hypothetical protein